MRTLQYLLFLSIVALLWSCQPDFIERDDAVNHLPDDAAVVLSYQPRALMDKAGYDETMQWPAIQEMLGQAEENNPYFARILENPAESGIDLDERFYFAMDLGLEENEPKANFGYWLFSIADAEKFARLWEEMDVPARPIADDNRYLSDNGKTFISWTDTWGIVGTGWREAAEDKLREIVEMKPDASLAANRNFRKCLARKADAAVWMSSNGLAGPIAASGVTILANYSEEDLKDNYLHHFLYFEDGLVRAESKFFIKRKIAADLDLLFRDEVKTDFTKVLPEGKLEVVFTAALNPRGINQILIEKYAKRAVQEAVKSQGLSFDDLLEALDGDIALAAYERGKTEDGLFIARIGERDKLDALLESALAKGILTKKADQYYAIDFEQAVQDTIAEYEKEQFKVEGFLLIQDDLLFVGSSEDLFELVRNKSFIETKDWQDDLRQLSRENIFAFLAPVFQTPLRDKVEVETIKVNANRKKASLEVHLENKDENSLYQLMQGLRREMEERQGERKS